MNKATLSAKELVGRWEERREIKNLMGRYAVSFLLKREKTMFSDFWSERADVSMGLNDGWYVGREAIANWFVAIDRATILKAKLLKADLPDKLEDQDDKTLYGIGDFDVNPLGTPVIELADDLQTSKDVWYSQGSKADVMTASPVSYWTFGVFAADFVCEYGAWKIWHLLYLEDVKCLCGTVVADQPVFWEKGANLMENLFGTPTLPMTAHDPTFNWSDDFPHAPKACYSYDPKNGCCPEGMQNDWRPY